MNIKIRHGAAHVIGIILGVIVLAAIIIGIAFISSYNKAVRMDEGVKEKWAEIENQLKRRYDLIPNLVETVKGYAAQEKEIFEHIADARTAYFSAKTVADKAEASAGVERALSRLLMLQETYPELKSNENFLKLHDSLEGTENRISVARTYYNNAAKELNSFARSFFGRIVAPMAGVEKADYFELPDEQKEKAQDAPPVKF